VVRLEIAFARARTQVCVGAGLLPTAEGVLTEAGPLRRALVVSDQTVAPLHAGPFCEALARVCPQHKLHLIPEGDGAKSLEQAAAIYDLLAAGRFARDDALIALGGGVVSDLTGFVAGTWMRGTRFAVCPTTFEAAVDASIGGKTAVNHPAGKNLVGVFHQPWLVLIDPVCLTTLSERDLAAGLAESIKHGAIADPDLLEWHRANRPQILSRDPATLATLIERNVRIKGDFVTRDERDQGGVRAALNFGHTVGHALEAWFQYQYRHGECVALGMVVAARLSVRLGLLARADADLLTATLEAFGLPTRLDTLPPPERLVAYIARDKKASGGRVPFVLLDGLGRTTLRSDVPEVLLLQTVRTLSA